MEEVVGDFPSTSGRTYCGLLRSAHLEAKRGLAGLP